MLKGKYYRPLCTIKIAQSYKHTSKSKLISASTNFSKRGACHEMSQIWLHNYTGSIKQVNQSKLHKEITLHIITSKIVEHKKLNETVFMHYIAKRY